VLVCFLRALITFSFMFIVIRIMGKREISSFQPHEFVITLVLAELAAAPMDDVSVPMYQGLVPILLLLVVQLFFSRMSLRFTWARRLICGDPVIIIAHGQIVESAMRRLRIGFPDLIGQLRCSGYFSLSEVEYAIYETSGDLSVLPRADLQPVTPTQMALSVPAAALPIILILDGQIQRHHLQEAGLTISALTRELKDAGYASPRQVLYAALEADGTLYCQPKGGTP